MASNHLAILTFGVGMAPTSRRPKGMGHTPANPRLGADMATNPGGLTCPWASLGVEMVTTTVEHLEVTDLDANPTAVALADGIRLFQE